ncbi:hypothetical protein SAMN04488503_2270 [Humidesulfovibrio mexicanus]|uniref:Uncharacterized protein n=1 Tax=Humidesulfovibrio mexicanus TaxID=147047 RepID=A0A239AWA6_9BACT|nr:hypothetical protein [Humidesulfovibrio mexicanus]SNR99995.1 hypothetical protein SAMN04488503_2270 [Humidesulfovibrio mexicanus]
MQIIMLERGAGKTAKVIEECRKHGGYIVCPGRREAKDIADKAAAWGIRIPYPLTFEEFLRGQFRGRGVKAFHIDNADLLIQYMARGVPVVTASMGTCAG